MQKSLSSFENYTEDIPYRDVVTMEKDHLSF